MGESYVTVNLESKIVEEPRAMGAFLRRIIGNIRYIWAITNASADNGISYTLAYTTGDTVDDVLKLLDMLRRIHIQDAVTYTIESTMGKIMGTVGDYIEYDFNRAFFNCAEYGTHGKHYESI